jgi:hypothetical protein
MTTTFEVGSAFKIIDQATPTLQKILRGIEQIDAALNAAIGTATSFSTTPLGGMLRQMRAIADSALVIDRNVATAAGSTAAMVKEWDAVAASATAATRAIAAATRASVPAAGLVAGQSVRPGVRGGGGRHGPRQSFHVSSLSTPLPGGHASFRGGGNAAMAALGALGYGVYEEAQFEDAAFRAMFTAGVPTDNLKATQQFKALRDMIQNASTSTGAPIHQIEEATLTGIRQFAGMPWEDRMKVMPALIEAAAAEARLKGGTTVEQGMESLTGLAHMTKSYTPEQIAKLAPKFAYLSATSPMKLKQIEGAAGYAVPLLQSGLEIDPFETLLLQATMQRAGILNTKSGTWIREMAKRAMPGTSLMSKMAFKKHEGALREFGLVDDNDQPTWFNDAGKPDLIKMLDIAGDHAKNIPLARRAGLEQSLFGTQGAGAFSVLADDKIRAQVKQLRVEMNEFNTGYSFFEKYTKESPVQQARVAWSETQRILMDLGSTVLPSVNEALGGFAGILKSFHDAIPQQGSFLNPEQGTLGDAVRKGMMEGLLPGAALGWWAGGPWTGAAAGALIGGAYEGGKYLLGGTHPSTGFDAAATKPPALPSSFLGMGGLGMGGLEFGSMGVGGGVGNQKSPTQTVQVTTVLNVDGRRLAEAVTKHIVDAGNGPTEGSPYPDLTRGGSTFDFSLIN